MKEHDGKFGRIPIGSEAEREQAPVSISGLVKTDGRITGYVLSNGLKITIDERARMEDSGQLE